MLSPVKAAAVWGAVAGAGGTLALSLAEIVERRALGRRAVYDPCVMARAWPVTRSLATKLGARPLGLAMRWVYGPTLGAIFGVWRRAARRRRPARGVALGAAIYCSELALLPRIGATPPLRSWPRGDVVTLALHTLVFGGATALIWRGTGLAYEPVSRLRAGRGSRPCRPGSAL